MPFKAELIITLELFFLGGLHHAAARISGDNVYKHLKFEGGIHRVQRIPEVGLSSRMQRIHTGTMSVIVLPHPDEVPAAGTPCRYPGRSPEWHCPHKAPVRRLATFRALLRPKPVNVFPSTRQPLRSLRTARGRPTVQLTTDAGSLGRWLSFH